jgi:hypothetical protein
MFRPKSFAASLVVLLAAGPALAQDFSINNNMVQGYTNNMVNTTVRESMLGIDSQRSGPRAPSRPGPQFRPGGRPGAGPAIVNTRYRPSPAVTARVRQQFIAAVAQRSGRAVADQLGREFATKDVIGWYNRDVAGDGLHPNDVADALASYWVQNWLIAHGGTSASRAQISAARGQVQGMLSRSPSFARLSEAQRQEMAELFIYNKIVQGHVYADAVRRGDANAKRQLAAGAMARFRNEMGINLDRLTLTQQGFVPRG